MSSGITLGSERGIAIVVNRIDDTFVNDVRLELPATLRHAQNALADSDYMPAFLSSLTATGQSVQVKYHAEIVPD